MTPIIHPSASAETLGLQAPSPSPGSVWEPGCCCPAPQFCHCSTLFYCAGARHPLAARTIHSSSYSCQDSATSCLLPQVSLPWHPRHYEIPAAALFCHPACLPLPREGDAAELTPQHPLQARGNHRTHPAQLGATSTPCRL